MTHLGSQVSALADGQLDPTATERAFAHVAGCLECSDELAAARAARRALLAAFDVPADPDLTRRLLALGACQDAASAHTRSTSGAAARGRDADRRGRDQDHGRGGRADVRDFGADSVPLPGSGSDERYPAGCLSGELGRRRGVSGRWLVVATTGFGLVAGSLFVLGEQPEVAPSGHPAHALSVLGRAGTALTPSASTRASAAVSTGGGGWSSPTTLPDGYRVAALRAAPVGPGSLEVDLTGDRGLIVVTLRHGRLDADVLTDAEPVEIGEHTVHVLSNEPWHGVWQSGDTVVSVMAEVPSDALEQVVASYPPQPYDGGPTARILRGAGVVAGVWAP